MAKIEIALPAMGEGIIEATLTRIIAPVGTKVDEDDSIVEVATDKVDSEVPTSESGVVEKMFFNEGDVIPVGETIAIIRTEGDDEEEDILPIDNTETVEYAKQIENDIAATVETTQTNNDSSIGKYLSPLVRNIIKEENINEGEVSQIKGTGLDGRLTKRDVLAYIETRKSAPVSPTPSISPKAPVAQTINNTEHKIVRKEASAPVIPQAGTELIEMDRMRRLISDHMVMSKQTSPHVTSFVDVDMTRIVNWRNRVKDQFVKKYGQKLTFTPIFVEAAVKALRDFPMVNVSVDGHTIIKKNFINIGMATALPSGNLIVPVIKNADQLNLAGLASNVNDLANRARHNKLKPDEIQGSTFSITNVGSFGNTTGTPIINQPEAAILAVGVIQKKPAVIETPEGDTIGIRHQMIMAMSYDHRVVDGALGGMFLKRVADYLEDFDVERTV